MGNFPGDNCLWVFVNGQLFYEAIVWAPIVQGLIIWGAITGEASFGGAVIQGEIVWGYLLMVNYSTEQ